MRGRLGETLLHLIRERYGNQERFASLSGLSRGWVSQIVTGFVPHLGFPAFERPLPFFAIHEQEKLYQAWLADYAPSPTGRLEPTATSTDEEISAFLTGDWAACWSGLYSPRVPSNKSTLA